MMLMLCYHRHDINRILTQKTSRIKTLICNVYIEYRDRCTLDRFSSSLFSPVFPRYCCSKFFLAHIGNYCNNQSRMTRACNRLDKVEFQWKGTCSHFLLLLMIRLLSNTWTPCRSFYCYGYLQAANSCRMRQL